MAGRAEQLVQVRPQFSSANLPLIGADLLQEVAIALWQLLPRPPHDFFCLRHVPTTLGRPGARVARTKSKLWIYSDTALSQPAPANRYSSFWGVSSASRSDSSVYLRR